MDSAIGVQPISGEFQTSTRSNYFVGLRRTATFKELQALKKP